MQSIVTQLRERIGPTHPDRGCFATGTLIDELLPQSYFRRGTLLEVFGPGTALAVALARAALRPAGALAVIDPARRFYPPAAASMGIDLSRLIVVQPTEPDWITIQALSCPAIDAVLCWPDRLNAKMFRRWQLAAERGGSVGLLVRPKVARGNPSWASMQLVVSPLAIDRSIDERGCIYDCLRMVSELANPTPATRATGA